MKEKGFTLIELMVVVVIIGIVAGFSIPSFIRTIPTARLKDSADDLRGKLMIARIKAIGEGVPYIAVFTENGTSFNIVKDINSSETVDGGDITTTISFATGITSDEVPDANVDGDAVIIFSPRGEATVPGGVRLTNTRNEKVTVDVVTSGSVLKH
ncbi:GspH/FimT family pseudopilin [candidate division TA06 bacterium]|nr:GspH/FimT family pseudopilin [candidate division TA06 bacterium]